MSELILSGLIDTHVHLRTPGQSYKENFTSGTMAALAGGVTMVLDMPNNSELITNLDLLERKRGIAKDQAVCDVGFYLGTLGEWGQDFDRVRNHVFGLKVYMDDTTGGFTVTDPTNLHRIFRNWEKKAIRQPKPILVHAEGNTLAGALSLAAEYEQRIHVCHVSLAEQVTLIARAKHKRPDSVTAEVTPHHLFLTDDHSWHPNYQMKPPLSTLADTKALWKGLNDGTIDVVATDHAPHTLAEKQSDHPPFGVPGLETSLLLMLTAVRRDQISLPRLIEVMHHNPLRIFNLPEQPQTEVHVERDCEPFHLSGRGLYTRPHWTPFEGWLFHDIITKVILRGQTVFENGQVLAVPGSGRVLP